MLWVEMVNGLQVSLLDRTHVNYTGLTLTTSIGLNLRAGDLQELLIFSRFALESQNFAGKYQFRTPGLCVVTGFHSQTNELSQTMRVIHFPSFTLILTKDVTLWSMLTKRCSLTVNFESLLNLADMIGNNWPDKA